MKKLRLLPLLLCLCLMFAGTAVGAERPMESKTPESNIVPLPKERTTAKPTGGEVPAAWAKQEVERALQLGILPPEMANAYEENITRQDFCRVVIAGLNQVCDEDIVLVAGPSPFTDVDDIYVTTAEYLGIINGVGGGLFQPNGKLTRQEAAKILGTSILLYISSEVKSAAVADKANIDVWAAPFVDIVTSCGVMMGDGVRFNPKEPYQRQQAYITVLRMYDYLYGEKVH